jgi:cation diffusion facilitator CzcD-associated flavoprotein CzcO
MPTDHKTVIIGASAAGLACARCLEEAGLGATILEQHPHVGHAWRNHYDRLHLHTPRSRSGLPFMRMPASYPRYPSRQQVVDYLDLYAGALRGQPLFNQEVRSVTRDADQWIVATADKDYTANNVIIATGNARKPLRPQWRGMDTYRGSIIHTSQYRNGLRYGGKRVLVVGFGNSAAEIALCLHEHGALPTLSVRGAVNVIPRDILGIPVLALGLLQSVLPSAVADAVNAPLMRLLVGDITRYGLRQLPYGATTQIREHQQIPVLDIGTMVLIKRGAVTVHPGIAEFTETGTVFDDGTSADFDAVILGTGYRPAVNDILKGVEGVFDDWGTPIASGQHTAAAGLYFCGFRVVPGGSLREIGIEARRIAAFISNG